MRKLSEVLCFAAITLWIGGLWIIGYVVAPVLFSSLGDRLLAGAIAGKLFSWIAWIGLGCAGYLLFFGFVRQGGRFCRSAGFWLILLMVLMTVVSHFGIQPLMVQLKADALPREVMESVLRDRFATWHGISSILYLAQSLLGLWLVVWANRGLR